MPNRTYITTEEASTPGHKPMKDRITILVCTNAMIEPMIARSNLWLSRNRITQDSLTGIKLLGVNCLLCCSQSLSPGVADNFCRVGAQNIWPSSERILQENAKLHEMAAAIKMPYSNG